MKSLVVYYSRTNTTKKLAQSIADKTDADIEEITPKVNYQGKMGFARGGKHALQEKIIDLKTLKYDPSEYDVVYIGTPVWAGKSSTPILSYLKQNEGKFKNTRHFALKSLILPFIMVLLFGYAKIKNVFPTALSLEYIKPSFS